MYVKRIPLITMLVGLLLEIIVFSGSSKDDLEDDDCKSRKIKFVY